VTSMLLIAVLSAFIPMLIQNYWVAIDVDLLFLHTNKSFAKCALELARGPLVVLI